MKTAQAFVGAKGVDTIANLTNYAAGLRAEGIDFAVRYLGSLTAAEANAITAAGLALFPVTYGNTTDGPASVRHLTDAGFPEGCTVWLDLEGRHIDSGIVSLIDSINAWADCVKDAGFDPGIYVGANSLLSSAELYALRVDRYWHSMSRVADRLNNLAEPKCGWCMFQLYDTQTIAGVDVDVDFVGRDFYRRLPTWAIAG